MLDEETYKKTYKKELIRMWDTFRTENNGECSCDGVPCEKCPLMLYIGCIEAQNIFDIYRTVKKWSEEHPVEEK